MNKAFMEGNKKWFVSLYTSGDVDNLVKLMNGNNVKYSSKLSSAANGAKYFLYTFDFNNVTVQRLIFNEKQLTLCVVVDVISAEATANPQAFFRQAVGRVSFVK